MIRRLVTVLAIIALAATQAGAQQRTREPIHVALRGYQKLIKLDSLVVWDEVVATPAATWVAARNYLDSLKFQIHYADSARGILHANFHRAPGKVAGRQRSWTIRCGSGLAGDYADTWRLSLTYVVYVEPGSEPGKTRLGSAFFGGVDPIEGTSKESMPCPSTGNMENLLFKAVQLRVL